VSGNLDVIGLHISSLADSVGRTARETILRGREVAARITATRRTPVTALSHTSTGYPIHHFRGRELHNRDHPGAVLAVRSTRELQLTQVSFARGRDAAS
jgi:hypothetical protein